ncbi:MAG: zinc-binding dehydrogenase [Candidatus Omnitrophica bacterium]|nr:zinc-binding dehydrogenase [Candidatus Omnitrophota bacterium]MCK6497350.1 zinc-binding dehydrogenase [bacterium]NUP94289.1 zinc-binding dehydrogenase [Candidatus Omnitrophota bacterium]
MKAACIFEHGDLEKVRIENIDAPHPGPGEVLLEVHSAALNHLDIWVRKGRPGSSYSYPHVLGSDAAGVVLKLGEGVNDIKAGDEVILNPGLSCGKGEFCERGEQNVDPAFGIMGLSRSGAFAEQICVPSGNLLPKPSHLDWNEAAALPLAYLTAWRMLMTRACLAPGETVLIHGIGGGVAIAGLQLARLAGAEVLATSSSDEKLERARKLGARHTINYRSNPEVGKAVRELTGGRGVDIAFDTVGAATWPVNFEAVRRGGRIVHCGVTGGAAVQANISALYWNHLTVMGSTMGSHADFRQMVRAVSVAGMKPVIDQVFPLDQARQAMGRMEAGEQFGKIVLKVK